MVCSSEGPIVTGNVSAVLHERVIAAFGCGKILRERVVRPERQSVERSLNQADLQGVVVGEPGRFIDKNTGEPRELAVVRFAELIAPRRTSRRRTRQSRSGSRCGLVHV